MPGKDSLRAVQYYAHSHNRFWKIISNYFNKDIPLEYNDKKLMLMSGHVALWDTIKCCDRQGSFLDSKIKNIVLNDIAGFLNEHSSIVTVITNGKKAEKLLNGIDLPAGVDIKVMPSTSPANAAKTYDNIYREWKTALDAVVL
jgi:hypoxanthine-DNA glycosylase